jgi:hypothetical protein
MNIILIGYDLNNPGQNYDSLIKAIKSYGTWWHHLDSTWIVKTSKSPSSVRDHLTQHMDKGDEILVVDISGQDAAWKGFNADGSKWLKNNLG